MEIEDLENLMLFCLRVLYRGSTFFLPSQLLPPPFVGEKPCFQKLLFVVVSKLLFHSLKGEWSKPYTKQQTKEGSQQRRANHTILSETESVRE